jgi:hypothetical protein
VTVVDLTDWAMAHAALGYHVFPLRAGSKLPATKNGFHDATDDVARVYDWWTRHPASNVGIATGASDLLVIDLDPTDDNDGHCGEAMAAICALACEHGDLPETYEVFTPRCGEHWYYRLPIDITVPCSTSRIASHVDVRSTGGYVVAAGSILKNGCYVVGDERMPAPAPAWLVAVCQKPTRAPQWPVERNPGASVGDRTSPAHRRLQGAAGRVATAAEGQRNDTLNWAAHAVAESVAAGELPAMQAIHELANAAARAGLGETEALATIRSGLAAGMGAVR